LRRGFQLCPMIGADFHPGDLAVSGDQYRIGQATLAITVGGHELIGGFIGDQQRVINAHLLPVTRHGFRLSSEMPTICRPCFHNAVADR